MAESWSIESLDFKNKADIIKECAYLPEFFQDFSNKENLSKDELFQFFKLFFNLIKNKSRNHCSSIKEVNKVCMFFSLKWNKFYKTDSPLFRIQGVSYQCEEYFRKGPSLRKDSILLNYKIFFNAFFTKERVIKLTKFYSDKELGNILKKNYELN